MKQSKQLIRRTVILTALLSTVLQAQAAEPAILHVSAAQQQQLGIQVQNLAAPATDTRPAPGLRLSGQVVSPRNAQTLVSPLLSGHVQDVRVSAMQTVKQGQVLATMISPEAMSLQREYLQLAIQAKLAREKKERDEGLFQDGIIARSRVEESRALLIQAEAGARERQQTLKAAGFPESALKQLVQQQQIQTTLAITANSSGTLTELQLKPGQKIDAGMPVATISKNGAFWVEFQVAASLAAQIKTGDQIRVAACQDALRVTAVAAHVQAETQNRIVRAEQSKPESCLQLNQFVEGRLESAQIPAASFALPRSAIIQLQGKSWIFIRQPQGYLPVAVTIVQQQGEQSWIRAVQEKQLAAGAQVVVKGISGLKGLMLGMGGEQEGDH
ncbi:efflux RND transporter periplasmic adaptor subunit [Undibacterium luofuense]|uniref:Efflux RND transporter periplasmic adaptor subunit n=1 Tax=Undibacterium luofuense TaxID=2828733 RepID=A0A941I512_9BURK|nr:efflux RND transporter periplasmic adaptor subunit [Undibacterium luofuense]MBR7782292.1 efflux RND transporter periplasmic adaptor subunit [Undibacterium luofuense]